MSIQINELKDIPLYPRWSKIEKVNKGWSKDKKYYIEDISGEKLLLRISDVEDYDTKNKEYQSMKEISELGINMSKPVDFGVCNYGKCVYSLLTWIEGTAVDDVIGDLSDQTQYELGIKAGKILKKFHSISAPPEQKDWEQRMLSKFDRHLKRYKDSGIRVANDELALKFIQYNLHLLKNRPQTYQHGDFHIGNMILTNENELGIIDFNRWNYGDPFEEFYKMTIFSRELSIPFACGQINGYFDKKIPEDFFNTLALYLADVILFSIVWAIPYGEDEVKGMIRRAEMVLDDYDNFNMIIPKWFLESKY